MFFIISLASQGQVLKFFGRYDVSRVDSINDSTFRLSGEFVDLTGSYTAMDADTNDKIVMRGYNSDGKIVYDRFKITGIDARNTSTLEIFVQTDFPSGIQNVNRWPGTGSFPIGSPTADTSLLTYRASFYQNQIDPDYDAALDNLNLQLTSGAIGDGYWDADGQDIYNMNAGNVGIGTVTPGTKLDVDGVITATGGNSTDWNEAHSWGNHAAAGYLTTVTVSETDPVYAASAAASVTTTTIANWNEAYSWGDHSLEGYLKSITWPDTYTPTAHTQDWNTILNVPATYTPTAHTQDWNTILNVPATYTPTTHNHDHDALTNYIAAKHFYQRAIDTVNTGLSGLLKATSGKLSAITDNSSNWNTAYGWGNHASAGYLTSISWPATYTPTTHTQEWNTILNVPSTYTPTAHTHDDRYYTETEIGNFFGGSTPITGYNKTTWDALVTFPGFGTTSTTCAYGDHLHTGVYLPVSSYKWGLQGSANSDGTYDIYNSNDGNVRIGTTSLVQPGFGKLYVTASRTGTSNYAIYATSTGAGTTNYGAFFDGWGATNNYALLTGTNGDVKLQCPKFYLTAIGSTTSKTRGLVMDDATGQVYYQTLPAAFSYPGAGIVVSTGSAWGTSITDNSANWNTAYGWGNHASAGYLTEETDPQWVADSTNYLHKSDTNTFVASRHWVSDNFDMYRSWQLNVGETQVDMFSEYKLNIVEGSGATVSLASAGNTHTLTISATGTGGVGGSGTLNYLAKFTDTDEIGNSSIQDNGTKVGILTAPSSTYDLDVEGTVQASYGINLQGYNVAAKIELDATTTTTYIENLIGAAGTTRAKWRYGNSNNYEYTFQYGNNAGFKNASITLDTVGTVTLPKIKLTPEGGYAVSMIAGCTLEQGDIVSMCMEGAAEVVTKTFADSTYGYVVGVAYSSAATGTTVWVVTSGRALVKFSSISCSSGNVTNAPTKGYYASAGKSNCDVSPYSSCWEAGKANAHLSGTCNNRLGIITETKSGGSSAYVLLNILNNVFY